MKTLIINGKKDLQIIDMPIGQPLAGQVRIRMAFAGICGSDLHYYFNGANGDFALREALIPGHELSATVDFDPQGNWQAGTPVTLHPATFGIPQAHLPTQAHLWPKGAYLGSASTFPHTQGGMSEYMVVPATMLRALPPNLPLRRAALAEPLAVALHAINIAQGVEGLRVLVSGSGPIGLLSTFAAKVLGAKEVVASDVLDSPLQRAASLGADRVINVAKEEIPNDYFDVALECCGFPAAVSACISSLRARGVLTQVGMLPAGIQPIVMAPLIAKEISLRGSFRFLQEITQAIELLEKHEQVENAITHVFSASDAVKAFETAKDSQASGKVLIELWR